MGGIGEVVISKIIASIVTLIFETSFISQDVVKIDDAPSWYYKNSQDKFFVYQFEDGDIDSIDRAIDNGKLKLQNKINKILNSSIENNIKKFDTTTNEIIYKIKNDINLSNFIEQNTVVKFKFYNKRQKRSYVGLYIPKESITQYEKRRIFKIKEQFLENDFNQMMKELDGAS